MCFASHIPGVREGDTEVRLTKILGVVKKTSESFQISFQSVVNLTPMNLV